MWTLGVCKGLLRFPATLLVALAFLQPLSGAQASPQLDTSFGAGGMTRIGVSAGAMDWPSVSAMQRDGKVLVAGRTTGRQLHGFVLRLDGNGQPDSSFGVNGATLFDGVLGYSWTISQIEQRADGSILLAGKTGDRFALALLTARGEIDTTFASEGFFTTTASEARFVQQADGALLLVSDASQKNGESTRFALRLGRLSAKGALDGAFAPGGERLLEGLPADYLLDGRGKVLALPDGGVMLLATASYPGGSYLLLRLNSLGMLDSRFGSGGLISGYDLGKPLLVPTQMAVASDGSLLLAAAEPAQNFPLIWRVSPTGTLDRSFGTDGWLAVSDFPAGSDMRLLSLGAGELALSSTQAAVLSVRRYDARGVASSGFGNAGRVSLTLPGHQATLVDSFQNPAGDLIVPVNAAVFPLCLSLSCSPASADVVVASVDAAGRPKLAYGRGDGIAVWNMPEYSGDNIHNVLLDPSGKIILTGVSRVVERYGYMLTRLDANGLVDRSFGSEGRVLPEQYARCHGAVRSVPQANGAIVMVAGSAGGSYCQFPVVTAFRVGVDGAVGRDFNPQFVAPSGSFANIALAERDDGRLLYGTLTGNAPLVSAVLQQVTTDGAPDTNFGDAGRVSYAISESEYPQQVDVRILHNGNAIFAVQTDSALHLYKTDSLGRPVDAFGVGGQFVYPLLTSATGGWAYSGLSVLALADGSLLLGLRAKPLTQSASGEKNETLLVLRVSADGELTSAQHLFPDTASSNWLLLALPDASVLIARSRQQEGVSSAALYRLLPDNSFDSRYGPDGAFVLPDTRSVDALAIETSGRLLLAGQDASSAFLTRYDLYGSSTSASSPALEFYNTVLQHYFVTAGPGEIAAVEAGSAGAGWTRTGGEFRTYLPENGVPADALPVCRFYGTPGRGPNSHFYTVNARECALVKNDPGWMYEGIAFYLHAPVDGQCLVGQQAVYRVYNNRFAQNDSNHRYITDTTLYAQMQERGWVAEGVVFCGASRYSLR